MKTLTLTTIAALSISASAAMAVTIDFEDEANGFVTNTFSGLTFNENIQVLPNFGALGPGQTGKVARQATPPFGGAPVGDSVSGAFDGFTVSSLSFNVGDSGGDEDIFRLLGFDVNGFEVADSGEIRSRSTTTVAIDGIGIASFSLSIGALISGQDSEDGSSVFDNIVFETELAAVPLPATLPLVGFGLVALGAAARRRKS